ncbi:MAG TPA: hypothetical protein PLP83_08200 [Candidatus Aminicenantes bacterium]|nr:hypothetical protein [Candidatus Aminicenantes bacterium]
MNKIQTLVRKAFFYGAAAVAALGVAQKIANTLGYTLWRHLPEQGRLIEITAVGLLFAIAMQLHEIRLSLGPKGPGSPK